MSTTPEAHIADVTEWRAAADRVLQVAEAAAPLSAEEYDGLSFDETLSTTAAAAPAEDVVNARIAELLSRSNAVIDDLRANASNEDQVAAASIPVFLAGLELSNALLAAAQDRADAYATLGVDDSSDGTVSLTESRMALNAFQSALLGTPIPVAPLPKGLTEKLETLETAGADELIAIAKDATLQAALGHAVTAAANLGGQQVEQAFVWIKDQIGWLRRAAVKILEWVVTKFRGLVPEQFRDKFDEKYKELQDKMKEGIPGVVGDLVGRVLGRPEAEEAWRKAEEDKHDLSGPESKLGEAVSGQLKRIEYVSSGRKASSTLSAVIVQFVPAAAPQVQIALAAVALTMVTFVGCQVWDGFNDIERLVLV